MAKESDMGLDINLDLDNLDDYYEEIANDDDDQYESGIAGLCSMNVLSPAGPNTDLIQFNNINDPSDDGLK